MTIRLVRALSYNLSTQTRSTIERGRVCNNLVPVLRGNGTKIAPTGDICVQPPGEMSWIRGKLADHVRDHAVLSPEEVVLVTSSGTELSHPRPSQSLNNSSAQTNADQKQKRLSWFLPQEQTIVEPTIRSKYER